MIADPNSTVIVEFTGEKGSEVRYTVPEKMIMTNFYNYRFERDKKFHILSRNFAIGNSMEGMWNLLKMVNYSQTYDVNVEPFRCSEFYDISKIPTFDEHPMEYWTKDRVLAEAVPQEEVAAYAEYARTGKYNPDDGLWFTSHNSTYDIAGKSLWVTVREKYESRYEFKLE